jgi:hypothetical protein
MRHGEKGSSRNGPNLACKVHSVRRNAAQPDWLEMGMHSPWVSGLLSEFDFIEIHPNSLMSDLFARCKLGALVSAGAAICDLMEGHRTH